MSANRFVGLGPPLRPRPPCYQAQALEDARKLLAFHATTIPALKCRPTACQQLPDLASPRRQRQHYLDFDHGQHLRPTTRLIYHHGRHLPADGARSVGAVAATVLALTAASEGFYMGRGGQFRCSGFAQGNEFFGRGGYAVLASSCRATAKPWAIRHRQRRRHPQAWP